MEKNTLDQHCSKWSVRH